ncbi:MAG: M20 family metallopeptidase [Thermoplasmata archaeon]
MDVPSPTGSEANVAEVYLEEMQALGLRASLQEVEPGRPNAVGRWPGHGTGRPVLLDGHLDTSFGGTEPELVGPGYETHLREEGALYVGMGTFNMKGALAAYLGAVKALLDAGVELPGDVTVAGVVGEIEKAPVDRYQGPSFQGYGRGTQYLIGHGLRAEWAVLGEPTGLEVVRAHFGTYWVRLRVAGEVIHTAWSGGKVNAIESMARVLSDLDEWRRAFATRASYEGLAPILNVAAIEGGWPWRAARTPSDCRLYVDVRTPPGMEAVDLDRELAALFPRTPKAGAVPVTYELYVTEPGTELAVTHPLVRSLVAAHTATTGSPPAVGVVRWYSDAALLNRAGVATVNYGPSGRLPGGEVGFSVPKGEFLSKVDLEQCTRVYVDWLVRATAGA